MNDPTPYNHHFCSSCTDVTIAFEEMSYSVLEGREIDVCLILTGTTDIDVSANLQVGDITTASM